MLKKTYGKFNLFHCTTGHVQVIYITYTHFRGYPFIFKLAKGRKLTLLKRAIYIGRATLNATYCQTWYRVLGFRERNPVY